MGQSSDRLKRVSKNLRSLPFEGVTDATNGLRRELLKSLKSDTGGDRKLSGLKGGKAQTVVVKNRKLGNLVDGSVKAGPGSQRAPWFWLEEGTRAGTRYRRSVRGRATANRRGYYHPGTTGKRTWSRIVSRELPRIRRDFDRRFDQALKE